MCLFVCKTTKEIEPKTCNSTQFSVVVEDELVNEYEQNHVLLSGGFPHLFPRGLTEHIMGTATVKRRLQQSWFNFYDARCARDSNLLFLLFNQEQRHAINRGVSFKIKNGGKMAQSFVDLCNEPDFQQQIDFAAENPDSDDALDLKDQIEPLIEIIENKISWTPRERKDSLGQLYSMAHFFGGASWFITISPNMSHRPLALRLAATNTQTGAKNHSKCDVL